MHPHILKDGTIPDDTRAFYCHVLSILFQSKIPFLGGGAYALACYTGIIRHTKDFDVFCLAKDAENILNVLADTGYKTEMTDKVWLAKAFCGDSLVDVIFGSANGLAQVDEEWFAYSQEGRLLDFNVKLIPPEEMIWSKACILTRDRCDLADIVHIILRQGRAMDWRRLLRRFGSHWRLLYSYLIMFGYIYPDHRYIIPSGLMDHLAARLEHEAKDPPGEEPVCRGTLLSTTDYLTDVKEWGFINPRSSRPSIN